jgi:hypothetical protein
MTTVKEFWAGAEEAHRRHEALSASIRRTWPEFEEERALRSFAAWMEEHPAPGDAARSALAPSPRVG